MIDNFEDKARHCCLRRSSVGKKQRQADVQKENKDKERKKEEKKERHIERNLRKKNDKAKKKERKEKGGPFDPHLFGLLQNVY